MYGWVAIPEKDVSGGGWGEDHGRRLYNEENVCKSGGINNVATYCLGFWEGFNSRAQWMTQGDAVGGGSTTGRQGEGDRH